MGVCVATVVLDLCAQPGSNLCLGTGSRSGFTSMAGETPPGIPVHQVWLPLTVSAEEFGKLETTHVTTITFQRDISDSNQTIF